ncbi:PREDICTED: uncharacterized protein LOC106819790 [Priapulus caudatus]|uniref:Uncharacterized protein LOC106819790 n=1 Tax=Priapulus caudatus TaxID=37621 RepID=A0ABM1F5Z1_PRICU|nr:PREDICTED: uncharacterized protein LOC106819790 [Priapulus caudatus]
MTLLGNQEPLLRLQDGKPPNFRLSLLYTDPVVLNAEDVRNHGPLDEFSAFPLENFLGTARPIDGRPMQQVMIGADKLEVVPEFCYLGDMLSAGRGCKLATITRCKCAWGKFRQLLPLLTNCHLPLLTRGRVYSTCVKSSMLHASKRWATKAEVLNRLRRNDRAMIRWICNVKAKDEVSSDSLLVKLGIQDVDVVLHSNRLRWLRHVEHSTGWIARARKIEVIAQKRAGRPKKTWDEVVKNDRAKLGMDSTDPHNRSVWRGQGVFEKDKSDRPHPR